MSRQSNRVAGTTVDLDDLTLMPNSKHGKIRMLNEIGDDDILKLAPHLFNHAFEQIMRQWSLRNMSLHASIDTRGFKDSDDDRKIAVLSLFGIDFAQVHHLLISQLTDDNTREFHLYEHLGSSIDVIKILVRV